MVLCYFHSFRRFHQRRRPQRVTVHGHSMFRLVDRPLSFRQRANEWIYKMLFLWSKEPAADPRASPWFAWFATAVILWRYRRRITKAILAVSPFRLLKRRTMVALLKERSSSVIMKPNPTKMTMTTATMTMTTASMTTRLMKQQQIPLKQQQQQQEQQEQNGLLPNRYCRRKLQQIKEDNRCKSTNVIKTRVKRLCTGDGPHISSSSSSIHKNHQVNYRVTRSGRVYGKYHNKIVQAEARC